MPSHLPGSYERFPEKKRLLPHPSSDAGRSRLWKFHWTARRTVLAVLATVFVAAVCFYQHKLLPLPSRRSHAVSSPTLDLSEEPLQFQLREILYNAEADAGIDPGTDTPSGTSTTGFPTDSDVFRVPSLHISDLRVNNSAYVEWAARRAESAPDATPVEVFNPFSSQLTLKSQIDSALVPKYNTPLHSYFQTMLTGPQSTRAVAQDFLVEFHETSVRLPDVTDKMTIVNLAIMAADAYVISPSDPSWNDVISKPFYNETGPGFGWEKPGIRGHVFATADNSTVIISYKGTSAAYLDSTGDTVDNDKLNDNLLFSCCCARVTSLWTTVCDCYEEAYTCNQPCLEAELFHRDHYYKHALRIYQQVRRDYPRAQVWLTGHSLGGALAALVGRTFGAPAVTFEAPGEKLAAQRLHLPFPPAIPSIRDTIWHFGHTADPIFMGVCNGASSSCSIAGYAMESQCHSGQICVYDVVADYGWHVNMLNHRIHVVIDDILEFYSQAAPCAVPPPCKDCFDWEYVWDDMPTTSQHSHTVTSSETSSSTPSLDLSSLSTETFSTRPLPCRKRNWYGWCIEYGTEDPSSSVATSELTSSVTVPEPTATLTATPTAAPTAPWPSQTASSASSTETTDIGGCRGRNWIGWCTKW